MSDYSLPVITKALLVFNILIHVTIFLTSTDMGILAISGQAVWVKGEYYRIITSAFTHAGILHIAMNMSSLVQLGSSLERQFGSLPFLFLTIWSLFLVGGLYVTIACTLTYITANNSYIMTPSVGYSGILFLYAILEAYHTRVETSSFFGVCNVPARMYPFILLFAIQFLLPGISFMGHVSGVIIGLLTVYGISEKVYLPNLSTLQWLESTCICTCYLTKCTHYVRCSDIERSFTVHSGSGSGSGSGLCSSLFASLCLLWEYAKNAITTILYIVGFPVERCSSCCHSYSAGVSNWFTSLFSSSSTGVEADGSSSSGNSSGRGIMLGREGGGNARYARLNQSSEHGTDTSTGTSTSTGAGETSLV